MVWLALSLLVLLGVAAYWLLARRRPPPEDEYAEILDSLRRKKKPKP